MKQLSALILAADTVTQAVGIYTPKRGLAGAAAVMGLISVVLARPASDPGRRRAGAALLIGSISLTLGGLVVATARGGLGTGNGLAGGVVAIVLGFLGTVLGWLAWRRPRSQQ